MLFSQLTLNKKTPLLFHYLAFLQHHENIFSINFFAKFYSLLIGYAPNTIKKDLVSKNHTKLIQRFTDNPIKYKELKNEFKNSLKTDQEQIRDIRNLAKLQILLIENKNFDNNLINTLKKFLTLDEINNLKKSKKELITLKASYFNFKTYLKILFDEEKENIDEYLKKNFYYLNNSKEKNWLIPIFKSKLFSNTTIDQQKNIRNIINQKQTMRYKTFKKYLNEEYKKYDTLFPYAIYLYVDYLEMLKNFLNIDQEIMNKFIQSI